MFIFKIVEKYFQWLDPDSLWQLLKMQGKLTGWSTATEQVKYFLFSSFTRVTNLALKITIPAYRSHCFVSPPRETIDTGKTWKIIHAMMYEQSKQEGFSILWRVSHPPVTPLRCLLSSCGINSQAFGSQWLAQVSTEIKNFKLLTLSLTCQKTTQLSKLFFLSSSKRQLI